MLSFSADIMQKGAPAPAGSGSSRSFVARELPGCRDLCALAAAFPQRYPGLLESVAHGTTQARFDILFAFPQATIRLDVDGRVRDGNGHDLGPRFLDALDAAWRAERNATGASPPTEPGTSELPFGGGWLLYLGYELAGEIEPRLRLPAAPGKLPVALALRCPAAAIVDHWCDRTLLVAETRCAELIDALAADLAVPQAPPPGAPGAVRIEEEYPQRFLDSVACIHDHLRRGDVFQVNLSREWRIDLREPVAPAALYAALRAANPAPFAGLLQWDDWALLSSSPERLIEVRGATLQTRPIAGTRPRVAGDDEPARIRELVGHPKERAEHVMLIDLERNDLGRVAEPGSITVDEMMVVESYAHVHHIVSNVRGRRRPGITPGEIIRAVFPGGTITGCPKVRCMEIIADREVVGRGAYTGSLGYLDRDGDMDLNILIRTLTLDGASVGLRAGAGIVADSVAEQELAETRAKARGLLRALGVDG